MVVDDEVVDGIHSLPCVWSPYSGVWMMMADDDDGYDQK
jgi:hypothetical protein